MKKIKYIVFLPILLFTLFISCDKGIPEIPEACVIAEALREIDNQPQYIETNNIVLGEKIFFSFCGDADYFVIYPGDSAHVLPVDVSDTTNFGYPMSTNGRYAYTYLKEGTYEATILATNVSIYHSTKDREFARSTATVYITVTAQ